MKATPRSQELDDWLKGNDPAVSDARPDEILTAAMRGAESILIPVPDPDRPVAAFERFWTVENLARWDFILQDGLARYVDLYGQMSSVPKSAPPPTSAFLKQEASRPASLALSSRIFR